ncbi:hypothetical protein WAI453_004384 [Rhynchosporium graminicola]
MGSDAVETWNRLKKIDERQYDMGARRREIQYRCKRRITFNMQENAIHALGGRPPYEYSLP